MQTATTPVMTAFTRSVSPSIENCQLTFMQRQAIDHRAAAEQHRNYEKKLQALGVRVIALPPAPPLPDAVFIEDTAVVVSELAVIAAPARESRRNEVHDVKKALGDFRPLRFLGDSATLEGGDIILHGKRVFIGRSTRTNDAGVKQLQEILKSVGYVTRPVLVSGCLHLSTGASYIGRNTILANLDWVDVSAFEGYDVIQVPITEPWAANVLLVNETVLMASSFPQTQELLERRGFHVEVIEISEFQKAEAGLTCMSLRFETNV